MLYVPDSEFEDLEERGFHECFTFGDFGCDPTDDRKTWSEHELRIRCAGRARTQICCGYCGKRGRGAEPELVRWFHDHACTVDYISSPTARAAA